MDRVAAASAAPRRLYAEGAGEVLEHLSGIVEHEDGLRFLKLHGALFTKLHNPQGRRLVPGKWFIDATPPGAGAEAGSMGFCLRWLAYVEGGSVTWAATSEAAALSALRELREHIWEREGRVVMGAVAEQFVPLVHQVAAEHGWSVTDYPCSLHVLPNGPPEALLLPCQQSPDPGNHQATSAGHEADALVAERDAQVVTDRWTFSDNTAFVKGLISGLPTAAVRIPGAAGSEPELAAWALEQPYGAIGMVHTEEQHRRRGFGSMVVCELLRQQREAAPVRPGPHFCYIVDGNAASSSMSESLGFANRGVSSWMACTRDDGAPSLQ